MLAANYIDRRDANRRSLPDPSRTTNDAGTEWSFCFLRRPNRCLFSKAEVTNATRIGYTPLVASTCTTLAVFGFIIFSSFFCFGCIFTLVPLPAITRRRHSVYGLSVCRWSYSRIVHASRAQGGVASCCNLQNCWGDTATYANAMRSRLLAAAVRRTSNQMHIVS